VYNSFSVASGYEIDKHQLEATVEINDDAVVNPDFYTSVEGPRNVADLDLIKTYYRIKSRSQNLKVKNFKPKEEVKGTIENGDIIPIGYDLNKNDHWFVTKAQALFNFANTRSESPWPLMNEINTDHDWKRKNACANLDKWQLEGVGIAKPGEEANQSELGYDS
jgi:hypothetical protein